MKCGSGKVAIMTLSALLVAFSVTFALLEIAFRFFPPTGGYNQGCTFDPVLGYRFKSYSQIIVTTQVWGFL